MESLHTRLRLQQIYVEIERNSASLFSVGMKLMCKVNQRQICCKLGHSQLEDHAWDVMLGSCFSVNFKFLRVKYNFEQREWHGRVAEKV